MKPLRFKVKITGKDLFNFSYHHANSLPMIIFQTLFSIVALYLLITTWGTVETSYSVLLIVCCLLFTVWNPFMIYLKAMKQSRSPMFLKPLEYEFNEEGMRVLQEKENALFPWDSISFVSGNKKNIIIYMDRIHAHVLPKNQLEGKEGDLAALIREHIPEVYCKRLK